MTTPGQGPDDSFVAGFLDDYFAECEEHFTVIRRALLSLEAAVGDARAEAALLEELFRSFHSVKGISAMVDLREAERLAHELESYLRALRDGDRELTADAVSIVIDGTGALEGVVAARRAGVAPPDVEGAIRKLTSASAAPGVHAAPSPHAAGRDADAANWRFTFVPSAALVERGIKVDTIRTRLGGIGRILSVAPKVTSGGGIAFDFLVAGSADPSAFEAWKEDGLTWQPADEETVPEPTAAHAPAAPPPSETGGILAPSHFVRVDLKRLDDVMRRVADLVVTRARLHDNLDRIERILPAKELRSLQENMLTFERQLRDLREDVVRVRLVRVDEIFRRMPFVARDVAREAGKDVRVVLTGQDTEIDKFVVERMMDPILHLVRNAVSHGIEAPEARLAAGKPRQGTITLSAATVGETVVLEIEDDGAGIDAAWVANRARAGGARIVDGPLDQAALLDVICAAGFSTRDAADRASGRGVGMSVVRTTVQELGGSLNLDTEPGRGTRFVITLPLTLAITDALIAVAGGQTFAVPQSSVQEVIEIETASIRRLENNELVPYRRGSLPLLRLGSLFRLRGGTPARQHAFVVGTGHDAIALGVDRILGQREIVVRSMADALLKIEGISGATELGDGRVVLILDVAALGRKARQPSRARRTTQGASA